MSKIKKNQTLLIYGYHAVMAVCQNPSRYIAKIITLEENFDKLKGVKAEFKQRVKVKRDWFSANLSDCNHQHWAAEVAPLVQPNFKQLNFDKPRDFLVLLDNITDPHNIGAIIRSAALFGASAVITTKVKSPAENATILKTAAGGFESVPYIQVPNLKQVMLQLKDQSYWLCGMDGAASDDLNVITRYARLGLVLGAEDTGMRRTTRELCDVLCRIAMPNSTNTHVESLNVAASGAIAMHLAANNLAP